MVTSVRREIDHFEGRQLQSGDDGYDEARTVYNAMVDRRPAHCAISAGPDDVARAIAYARRRGLSLAVKAQGHSVAGMSLNDEGVVLDVSPLTMRRRQNQRDVMDSMAHRAVAESATDG